MATKHTQEEKQHKLIEQMIDNCKSDEGSEMSNDRLFKASQSLLSEIDSYTGTKETEKHLIDMLYFADGYFHDEFTPDDINRMKYNIASDFPIFLETRIGGMEQRLDASVSESAGLHSIIQTRDTRIEDCEKEIKGLRSKLNAILYSLLSPNAVQSADLVENALLQYTSYEIIMEKLSQGIALNTGELASLKSRITNY